MEKEESKPRPFQKREELLNDCLCLCLKYNSTFQLNYGDLTLYRHAENMLDDSRVYILNQQLKTCLETNHFCTFDELCEK